MNTEKIICKYCNKEFRKLSVLSAHLCEQKRRSQQKNEVGVQLGYQAYLKFYIMTQGGAGSKTYDKDFVTSPYYSAFVKFGQYLVQLRAIRPESFTEWIIKENKKLDHWTKEEFYDVYLYQFLRKEHPNDALDRTFSELQRWADETDKSFTLIFKEGSPNKICNMIVNGRISPWVLLNSNSGAEFLGKLSEEQLVLIYKFIDPDFWPRKFKDYSVDTDITRSILKEAGL
jgi:hypothetical protein